MGLEDKIELETGATDRINARSRQIIVKDRIPAILAISVTGGFFSLLWLLAFHQVPPASEKILDVMIGSLATAWTGIVTYYFGSSAGSDRKTEMLNDAAAKPK